MEGLKQSSFQGENPDDRRRGLLKTRDICKTHASELQKGVAEVQSAKYETVLYRLMQRTGDDPDVVNALNAFVDGLELQSIFCQSEDPLPGEKKEKLVEFLRTNAESLNFGMDPERFDSQVRGRWRKDRGFIK